MPPTTILHLVGADVRRLTVPPAKVGKGEREKVGAHIASPTGSHFTTCSHA
jgi:hypothetical protein